MKNPTLFIDKTYNYDMNNIFPYSLDNKRYHTYLTGIDYRTFVNYWLGVNKGIGIHDATWRKDAEFGGETYKGNGSHGCINSPLDQVATLWEICEIGTPVILYY